MEDRTGCPCNVHTATKFRQRRHLTALLFRCFQAAQGTVPAENRPQVRERKRHLAFIREECIITGNTSGNKAGMNPDTLQGRKNTIMNQKQSGSGAGKRGGHPSGIDMLHGSITDKLILFALPVIAGSILQQVFNAADTAVVGRFASSQALAAVGGNASTISLLINFFVGITSGAGVVTATCIGRGDEKRISSAVHTAMLFSLFCGIFLAFLGQAAARPLIILMASPEDVIDLAAVYLKIYFTGMPFLLVYNMGASILRSAGDTRRPLLSLLAAGVLNVILNLIFVIRFQMSVTGVALATVISNGVNALLVLKFLLTEEGPLKLELKKLGIDRDTLSEILRIGVPSGLQGVVFSVSNVCIQTAVNGFGSAVVAGSAVALNFEYMCYFAISGFIQACMNFTGQNYGAGQKDRLKKIYVCSLICGVLSCMLLNYGFYFSRGFLLRLFSQDPGVLAVAEERMRAVLLFQSIAATYEIAGSSLRGMGYSMQPAVLTVFGSCLFRILWILSIFRAWPTLTVLFSVYPASWLLTGALVTAAWFKTALPKMSEVGEVKKAVD